MGHGFAKITLLGATLLALTGCADAGPPARAPQTQPQDDNAMMQQVEEQIARFRRGEKYRGRAEEFLASGRVDAGAIRRLATVMQTERPPAGLASAQLLAAIGRAADPLHPRGARLIREPVVVAALIESGLSSAPEVRDFVLETLVHETPAESLAPHRAVLTQYALANPGEAAFLVIAKAKPREKAAELLTLCRAPQQAHSRAARIARAALGEAEIEQALIREFTQADQPRAKAELAETLGHVATDAALRALAAELRTDLVIEIPGALRRSVRLDIIAALCRAFPDQTMLQDNAIVDDGGYARVEKFCEEKFGTTWTRPRPPFLTVRGFPSGG